MGTLLVTHGDCVEHDPGLGHPESPARLRAVQEALAAPRFVPLIRQEAPLGEVEAIARVHPQRLVEAILEAVPDSGRARIDADTVMSPGSGDAALRAAGAVTLAVDAVMLGDADNAFCAVRPPGHHAEPDRPMGFCLFNNVVIGARHAMARHGLERVAIMDFDVHHGNGTQAVAETDPRLHYSSTHQYPFYPGTGAAGETGQGNIINIPLPSGTNGVTYRRLFERQILPALERFKPELLMISAGFDAHHADPLASLELDEEDYVWITGTLKDLAAAHCRGRIVSVLEGGYDLDALAASVAAHVGVLAGI